MENQHHPEDRKVQKDARRNTKRDRGTQGVSHGLRTDKSVRNENRRWKTNANWKKKQEGGFKKAREGIQTETEEHKR